MSNYMEMIFFFAGGVALFLLGMKLMTDGLKIAAGNTLRSLLAKSTSTVLKGVMAGVLITALVQSSSAVIFATIGFVNAGLLTLLQAVYVILGSNVGTTLTGWIVALSGLDVNLQLISMPTLAIGVALWLSFGTTQKGALGQALAGFSIFIIGISTLQNTFDDLGGAIPFDTFGTGFGSTLLMVLIGIVLTSLMQSSSAAIAVVITAVAGGLIPIHIAAAMVIGADVGTTSTALFAVIGSTANAKRAAMAHVMFNLLKVPLALPFIGLYLAAIDAVFSLSSSPAIMIATFHTTIKLVGLVVILPFTGLLVRFLEKRFTSSDIRPETTRYLDDTVLETPAISVSALIFELKRVGRKSRKMVDQILSGKLSYKEKTASNQRVESLSDTVAEYIQKIQGKGLPQDLEYVLPDALRVLQNFSEARQHALEADKINLAKNLPADVTQTFETTSELLKSFLRLADSEKKGFSVESLRQLKNQLDHTYDTGKTVTLNAASKGVISLSVMVELHELLRNYRRIWDQVFKAAVYLDDFNQLIDHEPGTGPELIEPHTDHIEPSTAEAIQK